MGLVYYQHEYNDSHVLVVGTMLEHNRSLAYLSSPSIANDPE
jgi:hypothetical protein